MAVGRLDQGGAPGRRPVQARASIQVAARRGAAAARQAAAWGWWEGEADGANEANEADGVGETARATAAPLAGQDQHRAARRASACWSRPGGLASRRSPVVTSPARPARRSLLS